jgi:superfamily I DNA/RNA helicase
MTPTIQQQAFLDTLLSSTGHIALMARAGCGKTSTILMAVDALVAAHPRAEIQVCAFNKTIADEVGEKLKKAGHTDWRQVMASTLHSMGFGLLKFAFKPTVDDKKVRKLIDAQNAPVFRQYAAQINQLVGYAKDAGFGFFNGKEIGNTSAWYELADHFDVNGLDDTSEADDVVAAAQLIYKASLADTSTIDFADMILMPLVKNLRVKFGKDYIIGDESQDWSPSKIALVRKFLKVTGRLIIVGDDRQAIYGFAGADAEAMPRMIREMGMQVMPLSVTWRCPKAVVRLAQQLVPDIEAAPEAAEGEVIHTSDIKALLETVGPQDAILCRNTAPLIETAYKLIRAGKPCKVEGRAIGEGLINLARRWKVATIDALLQRLDAYQAREVQKAQAKGNESKVEEVQDRVATLVEICNACIEQKKTQVEDVVAFINNLFADGATNVTVLATYHRSKGREWQRVILWEHASRCPSRAARQAWQMQQEENLAYVAFTRAQHTLVFAG